MKIRIASLILAIFLVLTVVGCSSSNNGAVNESSFPPTVDVPVPLADAATAGIVVNDFLFIVEDMKIGAYGSKPSLDITIEIINNSQNSATLIAAHADIKAYQSNEKLTDMSAKNYTTELKKGATQKFTFQLILADDSDIELHIFDPFESYRGGKINIVELPYKDINDFQLLYKFPTIDMSEIDYIDIDYVSMFRDYANVSYKDQYVRVICEIERISSDGRYFSVTDGLFSNGDRFSIYPQNANNLLVFGKGNIVSVVGKVTRASRDDRYYVSITMEDAQIIEATPQDIEQANIYSADRLFNTLKRYATPNDYYRIGLIADELLRDYPDTEAAQIAPDFIRDYFDSLIRITSANLAKEYEDNEVRADGNYKNELIVVSGKIADIGKDVISNKTYITLEPGSNSYWMTTPQAFIHFASDVDRIAEMKKGDNVTIVGKCIGKGTGTSVFHVVLENSAFFDNLPLHFLYNYDTLSPFFSGE